MGRTKWIFLLMVPCILLSAAGCSKSTDSGKELARFHVDDKRGIIDAPAVALDRMVSSDGAGSLRIDAAEPLTIRLYETGDIDIEEARLVYRAAVRTEGLEGKAYLEMLCLFDRKGEYFSRGFNATLAGTSDWTVLETPFFLKNGQNPDNVKLNLVVDGRGTVWVDDIHLLSKPLP